jgi:tRNA(Ile)-lysidine synthase
MLAGGETVLVAVSGGADSVALLEVLRRLATAWRLTLHAAHVDHRLRPDSAEDAEFVRTLAARLGVPLEVVTVAVDAGGSLEAVARTARYRALEACAARLQASRIAVAHTLDDQAETVLMRLLAGAGVRGLAGIPPVRGRIIRPLIETRRAALVAALTEWRLDWVEDPSNRDLRFFRNRIRHELLPALASGYNPGIVRALGRVARLARESTDAQDRLATAELARLVAREGDALVLPLEELRALPRGVAAEVLCQAAARLRPRAPLRAWEHRALRRMLATPPPRRPQTLGGVTFEQSLGRLRLSTRCTPALPLRAVPVPGRLALPEAGLVLEAVVRSPEAYEIPREQARVAFDADALPGSLVVRGRRRGDRLVPFGADSARRVKQLLIDAKLPRWGRGHVPIVEAGGVIVWVAGLRRSAVAPVTARTRRILELSLQPLAECQRRQ